MPDVRALIAAAGAGSRAGLPYPKTLHPVLGTPILIRLLDRLRPLDDRPTVIVSPAGRDMVEKCLTGHGHQAHLVEQPAPTGMGDAVLCFRRSPACATAEHVLLAWGDIPFLETATIKRLVGEHLQSDNDFSFATRQVKKAYTVVARDGDGRVDRVIETREAGIEPGPGERDIGLFIFRATPVLDLLDQRLAGATGHATGEHGFLYLIRHLAERGLRVAALPIATERDLVSLNSLGDLDAIPAEGGAA